MLVRLRIPALLGIILFSVGCLSKGKNDRRTAFERDPLLMSHLTHSKEDPAFAETETDLGRMGRDDEMPVRAASVSQSKKPPREPVGDLNGPARSRAADYSWIRGNLRYISGDVTETGWYLDYGRAEKDKYGGRVKLGRNASLNAMREGDEVHVTGKISTAGLTPEYQIDSITLVDP